MQNREISLPFLSAIKTLGLQPMRPPIYRRNQDSLPSIPVSETLRPLVYRHNQVSFPSIPGLARQVTLKELLAKYPVPPVHQDITRAETIACFALPNHNCF